MGIGRPRRDGNTLDSPAAASYRGGMHHLSASGRFCSFSYYYAFPDPGRGRRSTLQ